MATNRAVQLEKFVIRPQAIVSFRRGATQLDAHCGVVYSSLRLR